MPTFTSLCRFYFAFILCKFFTLRTTVIFKKYPHSREFEWKEHDKYFLFPNFIFFRHFSYFFFYFTFQYQKESAVEKSSQNKENFEKTSEGKNSDTETKHFPQTTKKAQETDENGSVAYNLGFIASLGDYSDSSDSESSSSDSDILPSLLSNIESKPTK